MQANHVLSVFVLTGLIALTGCSDKTPVEETTEVATPEAIIPTDTVATESDAIDEPVAEVIEVVDENPPRFAQVTDYLALEPNTNWSWKSLADTPDIKEWYSKTPAQNEHLPEDPSYSIRGGLDNYGGIAVYGTQEQPEIITIGSGQAVMEDETGSAVYKLEDLFRESELTRVKSNCDKGENELFSQQFYKWEKPGHQPLYIYSIIDQANAGTSSDVGIAKSLDTFLSPAISRRLSI
ncbi:hypothetical protein [Psychrobacter jeotgali]|uniref:hypothetical protein n=1 Tax=Psychrobacter jeotgali TaxID=179010 RepID=UPI0019184912|nr:hypothetical protein [Psychrobacter jeotgali]